MQKKQPNQLGPGGRKVDPKLRMIANGHTEVNIVRAERCDAIAVAPSVSMEQIPLSMSVVRQRAKAAAIPARGSLPEPSADILANVFIATDSMDRLPAGLVHETGRVGSLATATISLSKLRELGLSPQVRQISLGQQLKDPDPIIEPGSAGTPTSADRRVGESSLHRFGEGVLLGVIDVEGFDFAHPDFLDESGNTRFEAIWDQGAEPEGAAPQTYGRVIDRAHMNAAIVAAPVAGAPAVELEPQSQRASGSHGTHVASIAAGNLGVARRSVLAGVLVSLGPDDADSRRSFYDSTRLAHAVDYLFGLGKQLGLSVSINVSLGTNGHAHDSSAPINRWIDALLAVHGRSVCVAAGNAGQDSPTEPGDIGWVMGRIHTGGQISASGLDADIDWVVAGRAGKDYSENELELWFSPQDKVAVSLRTPSGQWIGPVDPREFIENRRLPDGSFVSVYNELYHPSNGANYISLYLSPNFRAQPIIGVAGGSWTVRLHGREIRNGRFDGWIERDDPFDLPPSPEVPQPMAFPSFFSERSNVDRSSISTLACGHRVVAVANLDSRRERINASSSQGPTRDGRSKPDVAAPGTDVVAACGFSGDQQRWVSMTGTSMASPYVCGVVALMLAAQRDLSAAQIVGIIQRTARPLPGASFAWRDDAGFGAIDAEACVREAARVNEREDRTP